MTRRFWWERRLCLAGGFPGPDGKFLLTLGRSAWRAKGSSSNIRAVVLNDGLHPVTPAVRRDIDAGANCPSV